MILARRSFVNWKTAPAAGGVSEMDINRGQLEDGFILHVPYSTTLTGAGSGVREISVPVRAITVYADGKVLKSINVRDAINAARILEQVPLASLVVAASAATVATYNSLSCAIPIRFRTPRTRNGLLTALPTWMHQTITVRVEWGTVADLFTDGGTLAGTITFGSTTATPSITQLDAADFPEPLIFPGGPQEYGRSLLRSVERNVSVAQGAAANAALELDLGTLADVGRIIVTSELTSTGEAGTFINFLSLKENKSSFVYENVRFAALRADNARVYGVTMPSACVILDFLENGDIADRYRAASKSDVRLIFDTGATAGTIRAHLMTIEQSLAAQAALAAA